MSNFINIIEGDTLLGLEVFWPGSSGLRYLYSPYPPLPMCSNFIVCHELWFHNKSVRSFLDILLQKYHLQTYRAQGAQVHIQESRHINTMCRLVYSLWLDSKPARCFYNTAGFQYLYNKNVMPLLKRVFFQFIFGMVICPNSW